ATGVAADTAPSSVAPIAPGRSFVCAGAALVAATRSLVTAGALVSAARRALVTAALVTARGSLVTAAFRFAAGRPFLVAPLIAAAGRVGPRTGELRQVRGRDEAPARRL